MNHAASLAQALLEIEAVQLQPEQLFTWASGIQSPIYTDNRVALAFPEVRDQICQGFLHVAAKFSQVDAVVGVATAGIPHAALLADRLHLPLGYVRASAKQHGRQNRIEGRLQPGQRVLVVEDLISTGGSSLEAVAALREAGIDVLATLAIFTYGFDSAAARFAEANCPLYTLTDYPTLIAEAKSSGRIQEHHLNLLNAWRTDTSARMSTNASATSSTQPA